MKSPISIADHPEQREVLDSETLAALDEGIRSEQTGLTYRWEEVKKLVRERRTEWTNIQTNLNA